MSAAGAGAFGKAHNGDGAKHRHEWFPPQEALGDPIGEGKLLINNTLTGRKEVFVPMNGRRVLFYCCGPTVYDSTHVGHARTYLTFDIMRRVLSDYFMYDVMYQINITDIDDKIILRARQNELVRRLEEDRSVDFEGLQDQVDAAVELARTSGERKLADLRAKLAQAIEDKNGRAVTELEDLLKMQEQKQDNFANELAAVEAAKANPAKDRAELLAAARSMLAGKLDREQGASVTDHNVFNAHARKYEREYMEDMAALGIREPDVLTRVTEYIPEIIQFIEKIISNGHAYASNGSVYLSLTAFKKQHNYRKLKPGAEEASEAELEESEGALGDANAKEKRNGNDFALWKASKAGEPAWDSPWGQGRPGWHIECSVVASDILGERLDIHAGGEDLKFPHHDNELAQSEACFGSQQWVNYFIHTGHLHIKGLKMSKSLKNFVTIRQALEKHSARQLRILFLLQPWDGQMQFSDQTVDDAKAKEKSFRTFFQEVEAVSRADYLDDEVGWRMGQHDHDLAEALLATQSTVHRSLLNNFDTASAMLAMLELVSKANVYLRLPDAKPAVLLLRRIATYLTFVLRVFGVVQGNDDFGFGSASQAAASAEEATAPLVDAFVRFREQVRSAALASANKADPAIQAVLEACDAVRDGALAECGVRLEDRPDGPKWNFEDPELLRQERQAKAEKELAAAEAKRERAHAAKLKELERAKLAAVPPDNLHRTAEFSAWDDDGVPTVLADGTALSDGQRKKKRKALEKHAQSYADLLAKAGGDISAFIASLEAEVASLASPSST